MMDGGRLTVFRVGAFSYRFSLQAGVPRRRGMLPAILFGTVALLLLLASLVSAAAVTDAQIRDVRQLFRETSHGVPGVSADQVDRDFALRVYGRPGALGALERILAGPAYGDINEKLGQVREKAMLECWAEVVAETGVRIELNNAGKRNGGRSDLDVFVFTDADELADEAGSVISDEEVHARLVSRFHEKWSRRMPGTSAADWDIMVFDSMMIDWRMSRSSWRGFMAGMNDDIAALSATEGAYFIPGAYKDQVFRRYLSEGRTTIIESVADSRGQTRRDLDIPDGVRITADLPTREASLRYADVPGDIDRRGALGVVLQNVVETDRHAASVIKRAKYSNRWIEGYVQLTNLEKSYQKLLLEGRDGARRRFAQRLFAEFDDSGRLPPNIADADELMRVLDTMNRIELDKVLADMPPESRPANWSDEWRKYRTADIAEPGTKLAYFAAEVREMTAAMRAASAAGVGMDEKSVADLAEGMFMDKARQAARMAAASAAKRAMGDLFTRGGAARAVAMHGSDAAARQIVERVKGLHAAFVFLNDETMMRAIVAEMPPEARGAVDDLVRIARAQRQDILSRTSAVDKLERGQMAESDAVVARLLRDLGIDEAELRRVSTPDADGDAVRQRTKMVLAEEIGGIRGHNARRVYEFFRRDLPRLRTVSGFTSQYWDNVCDIGTVSALGQVATAWYTGDTDKAIRELVFAVVEGVPVAGKLFSLGRSSMAFRDGAGGALLTFVANQFLAAVPGGAKYAATLGQILGIYGLEVCLYELGWYLYGEPAQADLVSLVLMGSMNRIPRALKQEQSAMPMIRNDEDQRLVQEHAILRKNVSIPPALQESRELREAVLRAHFLPLATRKAAAESGGAEVRESILKKQFFDHWEYWLRRIMFFESVHPRVSRYLLDKDAFRQSSFPPSDCVSAENRDKFKAAFFVKADGSEVWNYEEVYLRCYFQRMLEEWIGAQRKSGEVMNYLNNPLKWFFYYRDWETQVVEELVSYYKEGELFSVAQDAREADLRAQLETAGDEAERARIIAKMGFVKGARHGTEAVLDEVLAKEGQKSRMRQLTLEKAYWHERVLAGFESSVAQAVAAQEPFALREDALRVEVKIPRPVGRPGGAIPMEVAVHGDARLVPEASSLNVALEYRVVSETRGRLPKGVLRDDILTLFGRDEDPAGLKFTEHELTVRLSSALVPAFRAEPVTRRVFWVALDDAADDGASQIVPLGVLTVLEDLRGMEDEARRLAEDSLRRCREGQTLVEGLERLIGRDEQTFGQWEAAGRRESAEASARTGRQLTALHGEAETLTVRLGELSVEAGTRASNICNRRSALQAPGADLAGLLQGLEGDYAGLAALSGTADADMARVQVLVRESEDAAGLLTGETSMSALSFRPLPDMSDRDRSDGMERATAATGAARAAAERIGTVLGQARKVASSGGVGDGAAGAGIRDLLAKIEAHLAAASGCPGVVEDRLRALGQRDSALRNRVAAPAVEGGGDQDGPLKTLELIRVLGDLAKTYHGRIREAAGAAQTCRNEAVRLAQFRACEMLRERFVQALQQGWVQQARDIARQAGGCAWASSAQSEIARVEAVLRCRSLAAELDAACRVRDVARIRFLLAQLGAASCQVDASLLHLAQSLVSAPASTAPAHQSAADAPVQEADRNDLLTYLDRLHTNWKGLWCAGKWSGCACVPDGARGELRQWIQDATTQRQLERLKRLADCYDACIMQKPLSESRVHQCRVGCKKNVK